MTDAGRDVSLKLDEKSASWLLVAILLTQFLCFWFLNRQYAGPAFLSDEIGYLSKAAAIAGHPVDMASSWRAGSSFFMAPAFLLFSEPHSIWQCIIVINALMWTISFGLLFPFLKRLFEWRSDSAVLLALAASAAYPTWISIAGYVFSTTAFVMVYMVALNTFQVGIQRASLALLFSVAVGYLYWIHPIGLAVAGASVAAVGYISLRTRTVRLLLVHTAVVAAMIILYDYAVHPWFDRAMTPPGYAVADHYKAAVSGLLLSLASAGFWIKLLTTGLGHLSYPVIASFGICLFFLPECAKRFRLAQCSPGVASGAAVDAAVLMLVLLSMLGAVVLGSVLFSLLPHSVIDAWIYGRYTDMCFLPMLGVAVLSCWQRKYLLIAVPVVGSAALLASLIVTNANTGLNLNLINVQSFWPAAVTHVPSLAKWFAVGLAGVLATFLLGKKYIVVLAIPAYLLSLGEQIRFHSGILASYSRPLSVVRFVRGNYDRGACVGFDPASQSGLPERRQLYSFYLYDFNFRRMSPDEWRDQCDGPYLSSQFGRLSGMESAAVVARGADQLFVAVKSAVLPAIRVGLLDDREYQFATAENVRCWVSECIRMDAEAAFRFSQVGRRQGDAIVTTGKSGFLFFGPYVHLGQGGYLLTLDFEAGNAEGARLEIVSQKGAKRHLEVQLSDHTGTGRRTLSIPFHIAGAIDDMETRLYVADASTLSVFSYEITRTDDSSQTR